MTQSEERFFFYIAPEFPDSKKWIVTVRDKTNAVRGVVVVGNKEGLILMLDDMLPDDKNEIDSTYEEN